MTYFPQGNYYPAAVPGSQVYFAPQPKAPPIPEIYPDRENQHQMASRAHQAYTQRFAGHTPETPQRIVMHPVNDWSRVVEAQQHSRNLYGPIPVIYIGVPPNRPIEIMTPVQIPTQQNQLQEAYNTYQRIVKNSDGVWPISLIPLAKAAETMRQLGDLQHAVEAFIYARNLPEGKQNLFVASHLAETLRQLGRIDQAIIEFKKALALPGGREDPFLIQAYQQARAQESNLARLDAASSLLHLSEERAAPLG